MTAAEPLGRRVDLAHEPDFNLGAMTISPSACRVRMGSTEKRLEPRMMQVLVALARAQGATLSRDELVEACWEGRIVSDDAVARIIAKVRALARGAEPPPFTLETIPKTGFRLTACPGEATTPGNEAGGATPAAAGSVWRRAALGALGVVAIAGGLFAWMSRSPPARPGPPSLTEVVAFQARGGDPAVRSLAVGAGETLIRVMSAAGMEVAPQLGRPADGAGADAAVFRVTGSVDRIGENYVADAQFLDRASGLVLLSVRFEQPATDALGFGENAALNIAGPIQCALEDRRRFKRPMAPTVFALYLNVCDSIAREDSPQRMLAAARRLVDAVPDEPTAHAMLGIAQAHVAAGMAPTEPREAERLRVAARTSAERALRLDPQTPKAYVARALSYPPGVAWAARERDFRKVQEIDPAMGPGRVPLALLLRQLGRLEEAKAVAERAAELADPRTALGMPAFRVLLAAQTGDVDGARALLKEIRARYGAEGAYGVEYPVGLWWEPDQAKAREIVARTARPRDRACAEAHLARVARGPQAGRKGLALACAHLQPDWRIRMLAREGDIDGAYAELDARFEALRGNTMFLFYPEMRAFRADPRFPPLARRLGLTAAWVETGRWPDFCAEADLPYDCRVAMRAP
ncbi:winged helix-turn-helix domain-containing protein [Phenylobacterium sp.]|uniref:winged helix-turn-helix domain-containing protein n=1 Tax=Phenylobacterium sp. TaxID=1871053 RepID=UPI0025DA720A|nr:winged helix-turn-helix domain-containing protein [Phenylobacterium sp.]